MGWTAEFVEEDRLTALFDRMRSAAGKPMIESITQLQFIECLRRIVKTRTTLCYVSEHLEYSSLFASVIFMCNDTTVKLQVYEFMCTMCVLSSAGVVFVREFLYQLKTKKALQHDYEIVVMELKQADTIVYQKTLMAFVNCLILAEQDPRKRTCIRNEFSALGLDTAIENMLSNENDELQTQIMAFRKQKGADEDQRPQKSYQELLEDVLSKISNTMYASRLFNILLKMSEMNYSDTNTNDIWNLINEIISNDPRRMLEIYRDTTQMHRTTVKNLGVSDDDTTTHGRSVSSQTLSSTHIRKCSACCSDIDRLGVNDTNVEMSNNSQGLSDGKSSVAKSSALHENSMSLQQPSLSSTAVMPFSLNLGELSTPSPLLLPSTEVAQPPRPPSPRMISPPSPPPPPPPPPPSHSSKITLTPFPILPSLDSEEPSIPSPLLLPSTEIVQPPRSPSPRMIPPTPPTPPPSPQSLKRTLRTFPTSSRPTIECKRIPRTVLPPMDHSQTMRKIKKTNMINDTSLCRTKKKVLNWTKIDNQHLNTSFWLLSNTFNLNFESTCKKIDDLFCVKPRAKSSPEILTKMITPKRRIVNILDHKRSLVINIALKQFKAGSNEILEALENGSCINMEKLIGLQQVFPTEEEIKKIKKFSGDPTNLGTAESFCLNLSKISNYQLKIKLMIEKEQLPATISVIRGLLKSVKEMCHCLIGDQSFKQFLSLILLLGNYLNAGSYAGNAKGFKFETLPKLIDTKANKPRVTFLHTIVEEAQNISKDMLSFTRYTSDLKKLSKIPLSSLEKQVIMITNQIKSMHSELSKKEINSSFKAQFSGFVEETVVDVKNLNEEFRSVTETIEKFATHFGEDKKKFYVDECFALLANFFESLVVVAEENAKRHVLEEKNQILVEAKKNPDCLATVIRELCEQCERQLRTTINNDN